MLDSVDAALKEIELIGGSFVEPNPVQVGLEASPLEFLQAVYRKPALPVSTRLRAAQAAAPFVHPKFSVVMSSGDPRAFADELDRRVRAYKAKLIEAAPVAPGFVRRI